MKPDCAAFSLSHPMGEGRGEGAPAYWLRVQRQMEAFDEPACGITGSGNTQDALLTPALSSLGGRRGRRGRQQVERWEKSEIGNRKLEIASFGFSLTDLLVVLA